MAKFIRSGGKGKNTNDFIGKVCVKINLVSGPHAQAVKGNIGKSFTIDDARVSQVYEEITRRLFGKGQ